MKGVNTIMLESVDGKDRSPEIEEREENWLRTVRRESLLPVVNEQLLRESMEVCLQHGVPMKFMMTLCPAFRNLETTQTKAGGPSREIIPFDEKELPRFLHFAREIAAFVVGTTRMLGIRPQVLLILNDIFEVGVEKRLTNPQEGPKMLGEAKRKLHQLFQQVDTTNPEIWPFQFQKAIRIVLQSDLVKPLTRFGLPSHADLVGMLIQEALDPSTVAFEKWLGFLRSTRADKLMSPNAWLTESGAKTLHERVRFLVAMYWVDGLVNPLLFKTIFAPDPGRRRWEVMVSPVFICGVTRSLQAEMEMEGVNFHLEESVVNALPAVVQRGFLVPRAAIHVIRNTASWVEPPLDPFTFGSTVLLR